MRREDEEHNRRQGERIILWKGITQQIRAFHVDIFMFRLGISVLAVFLLKSQNLHSIDTSFDCTYMRKSPPWSWKQQVIMSGLSS